MKSSKTLDLSEIKNYKELLAVWDGSQKTSKLASMIVEFTLKPGKFWFTGHDFYDKINLNEFASLISEEELLNVMILGPSLLEKLSDKLKTIKFCKKIIENRPLNIQHMPQKHMTKLLPYAQEKWGKSLDRSWDSGIRFNLDDGNSIAKSELKEIIRGTSFTVSEYKGKFFFHDKHWKSFSTFDSLDDTLSYGEANQRISADDKLLSIDPRIKIKKRYIFNCNFNIYLYQTEIKEPKVIISIGDKEPIPFEYEGTNYKIKLSGYDDGCYIEIHQGEKYLGSRMVDKWTIDLKVDGDLFRYFLDRIERDNRR